MAYTLDFTLNLGAGKAGLTDLRAQLYDTGGSTVGSAISTGFSDLGSGCYLWHYASFADAFTGAVKFYSNAVPSVTLAVGAVSPEAATTVVRTVGTSSGTRFDTLYLQLAADMRDPSYVRWSLTEMKAAINQALADSYPYIKAVYVDETITLDEDDIHYPLTGLTALAHPEDVRAVFIESDDTDEDWARVTGGWKVLDNNGTLTLYVDEAWMVDGQKLRIVYEGQTGVLVNASDATIVPKDFILTRAKKYLYTYALSDAARDDLTHNLEMLKFWTAESDKVLVKWQNERRSAFEGQVAPSVTWGVGSV